VPVPAGERVCSNVVPAEAAILAVVVRSGVCSGPVGDGGGRRRERPAKSLRRPAPGAPSLGGLCSGADRSAVRAEAGLRCL